MPSLTFCVQVRLNDSWACEGRTEVCRVARVMAALVADPKPPGEALKQVVNKPLVGVGG